MIFIKRVKGVDKLMKSKEKFICSLLCMAAFLCLSFQVKKFFGRECISHTNNNFVTFKNLDGNKTKICYNNSPLNDIIITKSKQGDNYCYSIFDSKNKIKEFTSELNIDLNTNSTSIANQQVLNAAAWAVAQAVINGEDVWKALRNAIGEAVTFVSTEDMSTIVLLINESGIAAIPEVISLMSTWEIVVGIIGIGALA